MTIGARAQCDTCIRFRSPFSPENVERVTGPFCAAFPAGIPAAVFRNAVDHRQPVEGDHGVRWESNGEPYPTWALAAR
jgi:hypothetical protein